MTDASDRAGRPLPSNPTEQRQLSTGRRPIYNPWLAEAKQTLLRCQRDFFSQVDGHGPTEGNKDVDKEMQQALLKTRTNTPRQQKMEIRRWALDQHIAEVLHKVRDPEEGKKILHNQMMALLSFRDADGGDNMWASQGFERFSCAIDKQESEMANLREAQSQREHGRVAGRGRELQAPRQTAESKQGGRG